MARSGSLRLARDDQGRLPRPDHVPVAGGADRLTAGSRPAVKTVLPPLPHRFDATVHGRLCVMAGCPRRAARLRTLRVAGEDREVGVCETHAARARS